MATGNHFLNTYYQLITKMYIYRVLMNRESGSTGLVPYNFDPEYSIKIR
jgi:hypothetical protein